MLGEQGVKTDGEEGSVGVLDKSLAREAHERWMRGGISSVDITTPAT